MSVVLGNAEHLGYIYSVQILILLTPVHTLCYHTHTHTLRHVIHTVGPRYNPRYKTAAESALYNCYRSVMQIVRQVLQRHHFPLRVCQLSHEENAVLQYRVLFYNYWNV